MESKHKQSNTFIQYAQMEMKEESNIGLSLNWKKAAVSSG